MAHKHFPADLAAHAASEQFVTQVHAVELVKALEALFAPNDLNGGRNGVGKISHDNPRFYTEAPASTSRHPNAPATFDAAPFQRAG
ncbi:hypothetical protein D3C87_1857560 [compost metagenome]